MKKYISKKVLDEVTKVLTFGDKKHPGENWKKQSIINHICHAVCHILYYLIIKKTDKETECSHLAHAVCRLLFAIGKANENNIK